MSSFLVLMISRICLRVTLPTLSLFGVLEPEAIRRELAQGAKLSLAEVLRLRVRYFSDGVVLGSQHYVNEVFAEFRERFGPRRKSGARPLRGLPALSFLTSLRDLRKDAVS